MAERHWEDVLRAADVDKNRIPRESSPLVSCVFPGPPLQVGDVTISQFSAPAWFGSSSSLIRPLRSAVQYSHSASDSLIVRRAATLADQAILSTRHIRVASLQLQGGIRAAPQLLSRVSVGRFC
jgi:hypothetical protein